ncbi:MAG: hypothetical protein ABW168_17365 [Sedimenticola sp.]
MGTFIAVIALLIAAWQLHLQRKEIEKGNAIEKLSSDLEKLRVAADMIKGEVDLREKIIADKKTKKSIDWDVEVQPHIDMVNKILRPSLMSIQKRIVELYGGELSELKELPKHFYAPRN